MWVKALPLACRLGIHYAVHCGCRHGDGQSLRFFLLLLEYGGSYFKVIALV
jgi:hypothetical protein